MSTPQVSVVSLDDDQLIELINAAEKRLLFVSPGLSIRVGEALARRWIEIGPHAVQVLLDIDPEVCRLGYGDLKAIQLLQRTASQVGGQVHHRPGIRIGLLVSDNSAVVFSPTPLLIEGESTELPRPNAIRFDATSPAASQMLDTFKREAEDLIQGADSVESYQVEKVTKELTANPPLKFDLARIVRVFNSYFQFVEFELSGLLISRMTVPIRSDLMGLARDEKTQKLLRSTFKLIGEESGISGDEILEERKKIADKYLIALTGYGTVCLRMNKESFLDEVQKLRQRIDEFQKKVAEKLQSEMDANRDRLVRALLPSVAVNPPSRWIKFLGPNPSRSTIQQHLVDELAKSFGTAQKLIREMKVTTIFKDVTYESLTDPKFIEMARRAIPSLKDLHIEGSAAVASET